MNPNQNDPESLNNNAPQTPQIITPQVQPVPPQSPSPPNNPVNTINPVVPPTPQTAPSVDPSQLFQPDQPGVNPFKSNISGGKRRKIILSSVAFVIVIGLGLGWIFAMYLPNKPQAVWRTGLDRTGSTINKLVIASTEKDKLEKIKKSQLDGSLELSGEGTNFSGSFSSKYDTKSTDNNLDVKYKPEGGQENKLNAQVKTDMPEGSDLPNIYFKVTGLKLLGVDQFYPAISEYDGRWISVSSDYLNSIIPADQRESFKKDQENSLTADDAAELARILSSTTEEYVFSSDTSKSVLVQKKYVGTEKLDGITGYHYQVGFNKKNVTEYCKTLVNRFTASTAYKKLPGVNADNVEKDKQSGIKNCEDSEKDVNENYTFDMWIDKKYKLVHKLKFTDDKQKGTYVEVGQTFKGDDSVLPLFANFHSDEDKYDGKLTLEVNTEQSYTKGAFDIKYDGETKYSAKASFEFKPYEGNIDAQKPAGAIPIEEVFKKLGFNPVEVSQGVNSKAKDAKIKADINSIYSQLEVYFAQNGYYPSLGEVNDSSWRAANFQGMDSTVLNGPDGNSSGLAKNASAAQYGYSTSGCDSKGQKCSGFILTGIVGSGSKFTKNGSNN